MQANELTFLIAVPVVAAIINIFFSRAFQKLLCCTVILYLLFLTYSLYIGSPEYILILGYRTFYADKLSLFALIFIQILGAIILLFSLKGIDRDIEKRFFILYPLTLGFCNAAVISINYIGFIISWGLSGLVLYLFALLGKSNEAPKSAKKTFIIVGGSDVFLIMGFVLIFRLIPGFDGTLSGLNIQLNNSMAYLAFFCLLIAALAKSGGFPVHTWIPDFCKDAPAESVAFLPASVDKLLGIYLFARLMTSYFSVHVIINLIMITAGAVTVITAVMMALNQHNGRRLLGYHAVSQVGYMIMGVGSGNLLAYAGGLFHLINNTIYKTGLFLSLGSVEKQTRTNELDYLGGLGRNMPFTFLSSLIFALSISGIPPFNGFFSKWMIYQGLLEKTNTLPAVYQLWMIICIVLALFGSALTLASFMKFLHAVFLGKRPGIYQFVQEAPLNQLASIILLSVICIAFGLFALDFPLKYIVYPAAAESFHSTPGFLGLYDPQMLFILFAVIHLIGIIIFSIFAKVRYDDLYLGGNMPSEKFTISGTGFYSEIRNMQPLKLIYNWAENKYFDIYELFGKMTFSLSGLLQKAHPGQLQLYLLYIIIGMLVMILLL
ncbi:MAG: proton-conducting transporter membrane subunit [Bacillota bacterium]